MKTLNLSLTKIKQLIHAYIPLLMIILFPKSITAVIMTMAYIAFSGYIYINRIENKAPVETYETYTAHIILTLIILALHINAI